MKHILIGLVCLAIGYGIGYLQFESGKPVVTPSSVFEQLNQHSNNGFGSKAQAAQNQNNDEEADDTNNETLSTLDKIRQIEGLRYTDFARLALSPTVEKVTEIIEDMSPGDLSLAINSLTGMDREEIQSLGDTHSFSKNLVKVVLRNTRIDPTEGVVGVTFGTKTDSDNIVQDPQERFTASIDRIYASFALPTQSHEKIMVKWFRVTPYSLQIMNRYRINPSKEYNFVWFRPSNWEPGLYAVEVFSMDSDLTLLASGSFEIAG